MKFSWCFVYLSVTLGTVQRATADEIVSNPNFTDHQIKFLDDLKKNMENIQQPPFLRSNVQTINKKMPTTETPLLPDLTSIQIPTTLPTFPPIPNRFVDLRLNTTEKFSATISPSGYEFINWTVPIRHKILDPPNPMSFWRTSEIEKEKVSEIPPPTTQVQQIQEFEKRLSIVGDDHHETDRSKSLRKPSFNVDLELSDRNEKTTNLPDQNTSSYAEIQGLISSSPPENKKEQQTENPPADADYQSKTEGKTINLTVDPNSTDEEEIGNRTIEQSQQDLQTQKFDPTKLEDSFRKNEPLELDLSAPQRPASVKQTFGIPDAKFSKPVQKTTEAETITVSPEAGLTSPTTENSGQGVEETEEAVSKSTPIPEVPEVPVVPRVSINTSQGDDDNVVHDSEPKDNAKETNMAADDHEEIGTVTELGGEPGNLEQDHSVLMTSPGTGVLENENRDAEKLSDDVTEKQQKPSQRPDEKVSVGEGEEDRGVQKSMFDSTEKQNAKQKKPKNEDDDENIERKPTDDKIETRKNKKQKQLKAVGDDEEDERNPVSERTEKQQKNKMEDDDEEADRKSTTNSAAEKQPKTKHKQKQIEEDEIDEDEDVENEAVTTKKHQKTKQKQHKSKIVDEDGDEEDAEEEGQKTNLIDETETSSDTQIDLENTTTTMGQKKTTTPSTSTSGLWDYRLSSSVKPERVDIRQLPFMAISVTRLNHEKYKRCAATVITEFHVLSAAHCYFDRDEIVIPSRVMIVAAQTQSDINKLGPHTQLRVGEDVSIFPGYGPLLFDSMIKNLAVVKVRKPFEFNSYLKPVAFRTTPMPSIDSLNCYMPGWNITDAKSKLYSPNQLSRINASVALTNTCPCLHWLHTRGLLCPDRETEFSICNGDYGGPLICDNELVGVAHGLVSENCSERIKDSEDVCSLDKVTVYLNLCPYLGWLSGYVRELRELDDFPCSDPDSAIHHAAHTLITGLLLLIVLRIS